MYFSSNVTFFDLIQSPAPQSQSPAPTTSGDCDCGAGYCGSDSFVDTAGEGSCSWAEVPSVAEEPSATEEQTLQQPPPARVGGAALLVLGANTAGEVGVLAQGAGGLAGTPHAEGRRSLSATPGPPAFGAATADGPRTTRTVGHEDAAGAPSPPEPFSSAPRP